MSKDQESLSNKRVPARYTRRDFLTTIAALTAQGLVTGPAHAVGHPHDRDNLSVEVQRDILRSRSEEAIQDEIKIYQAFMTEHFEAFSKILSRQLSAKNVDQVAQVLDMYMDSALRDGTSHALEIISEEATTHRISTFVIQSLQNLPVPKDPLSISLIRKAMHMLSEKAKEQMQKQSD